MADASEDYSDIGKSIEIINLDNKWTVAGLHTILLRPKMDSFVTGFLAPLFQSWKVRLQIMTYAQGTKVLGIPKNWLSRIELDYPKEIEQQKIAGFFSAVDERIAQLEKKKELLLKYKKGVMQQIFSQKIRFKAPSGNSFSDWEEKRLRDVCQINPKTGNLPEEFIYIDLESVECGSLNKETTILRGDAPSRAQRVLKRGDILFQTVRPYQSNNLIFDREGHYVASTGYA
ncbi:MAG TPA: hypothetical protein DEP46_17600, partial [Blastocatellia bacterium]|nr:hypothetical protein [Blastocatellia bacterium]